MEYNNSKAKGYTTVKGSVTVYMSLIFLLLMSFIVAIMESASLQMAKSYKRADVTMAIENAFAEYQIDLLEEYGIFALDATYETGEYDTEKVIDRIRYYGAGDAEANVTDVGILTDNDGEGFIKQVVEYMKSKYGIDALEGSSSETDKWEENADKSEQTLREEDEVQDEIEDMLSESGESIPSEDNPIEHISDLKNKTLLELVMPKDAVVSTKTIDRSILPSKRALNTGFGDVGLKSYSAVIEKAAICEYVLDLFNCYGDEEVGRALDYEIEYIIAGNDSDEDNLESVLTKIQFMRFGLNYIYIQTDSELKSEARTLATTLCSLLTVPAVSEVVTQAILIAWAYGEAIMDIRSLMDNKKVHLYKTKDSWQLQLSSLLTLGTQEDTKEGMDSEGGMSYRDYLRIILYIESCKELSFCTMDLIEVNLNLKGRRFVKMDSLVYGLSINSICSFRRNITYEFKTGFVYK